MKPVYKLLIVDDETHVRLAISALGNWEELGIMCPLEAMEGQSALEIMRRDTIDIVLVDIKMPIMNGMEFLKIATAQFPHVKYIIVSGYGEFEYAKKAIQYNVSDYLLKPVVQEELNKSLQKVVSELDCERQVKSRNPMLHITKRLSSVAYLSPGEENYFGIIVLHVINHFNTDKKDEPLANLNHRITDLLEEYWDKHSSCFALAENQREILLAVTISKRSPAFFSNGQKLREYVASSTQMIIKKLFDACNIYAIAGVGSFSKELHLLYTSYYDALDIINNANILKGGHQVYTSCEVNMGTKWVSVLDKKELFMRALEKGNMEYAKDIIEKYFESITRQGFMSIQDLRHTTMEFIIIFREIAAESKVPDYKNILPSINHIDDWQVLNNASHLIDYLFKLFHALYENVKKVERFSIRNIVQEIKQYVDNHYDSEISLGIFASRYHMTKEYLSKQFKEEFGCGIYEYVLQVKMNKAVQMLENFEVKIHDIAERLGYTDNNYFSRAFKNYYGVSPKEYRNSKIGNN
ncbi:MAG: AraC family transcriptional regulator [Clostridia bacterium]|jgi:two-component system response regulator YesN|nr:AraC family transcriptional regulator [Clostridia bacterium]